MVTYYETCVYSNDTLKIDPALTLFMSTLIHNYTKLTRRQTQKGKKNVPFWVSEVVYYMTALNMKLCITFSCTLSISTIFPRHHIQTCVQAKAKPFPFSYNFLQNLLYFVTLFFVFPYEYKNRTSQNMFPNININPKIWSILTS